MIMLLACVAGALAAIAYVVIAFFVITGAWRRAAGDDPAISPVQERTMLSLVKFPSAFLLDSIIIVPLLNAVLWGLSVGLLIFCLLKFWVRRDG
jgi:hypothetical protein